MANIREYMQHIVHIFIGEDLISFRDLFATTFQRLHTDVERPYFTVVSLTEDEAGNFAFSPDNNGDALDGTTINCDNKSAGLLNYFEDMYGRKVTVDYPGNHSMVVVFWAKLFSEDVYKVITELTTVISACESNFKVEVVGFTHNAVSCFIPNTHERLAPEVYRSHFENNIAKLKDLRSLLSALRLIENRNIDNVALNLNEESMARVCAEFSLLLCKHYLSIRTNIIESSEYPFETFGVSSILFDLEYYKKYIRNRILIDKIKQQGVENRSFNINKLATQTNPILKEIQKDIHEFYKTQVSNAKGLLGLSGDVTDTNLVGTTDAKIKDIINGLREKIKTLLSSNEVTVFEKEALLSLILGDDCTMFESSAVDANETLIDDIIDKSAKYFINLDSDKEFLNDVSQKDIKAIRRKMRNIAVVNREREEKLKALETQQKNSDKIQRHIEGNGYRFGGIEYKLDLDIDEEPLEQTYEAHDVQTDSIDLRKLFEPIRNQGKQGSCSSFAISSVIEVLRHDKKRYSPAFLYWSSRDAQGTTDKDSGASLYSVIKSATERGDCTEDKMPYNPDVFTVAPSESAINNALGCKVLEAKTVEPKLRDIKSALSDGFPVIIASKIFDSFSETRSGFVKHPSSEELSNGGRTDGHGIHAMVVCGFSDNERILVVRNSWGTDFGDKGYCYIPYSYVQQYFLQACIITKVTSSEDSSFDINSKNTIDFNTADANIESAILQNLIEEDRFELEKLELQSNELKGNWTKNTAILGNVNRQADIVKHATDRLDEEISEENEIITNLQNSKREKTKAFKRDYILGLICMGVFALITWVVVSFLPDYTLPWIIAAVITTAFFSILGAFSYKWRKFRQELRDEIQRHSNRISRIIEEKESLGIKAHIHGTIIKEAETYKIDLSNQTHILHAFNESIVNVYNKAKEELQSMSPTVPYPFLAILNNELLERYYSNWNQKMLESINFDSLFEDYTLDSDLNEIISDNPDLNDSIVRGLRNFSMRELVARTDNNNRTFLPDRNKIDGIFPELDARSKPFCYYRSKNGVTSEKYIFINDIRNDDINNISRFFAQAPMPIATDAPYSINLLNIVRYNIE